MVRNKCKKNYGDAHQVELRAHLFAHAFLRFVNQMSPLVGGTRGSERGAEGCVTRSAERSMKEHTPKSPLHSTQTSAQRGLFKPKMLPTNVIYRGGR